MYWSQVLSVFGLLAVIILVLVGAYFFTRWAGQGMGGGFITARGGSRIQVLDRAVVSRDQVLMVVRVGQRYLLLGSTLGGLSLLTELTREEGEAWEAPASPEGPAEKRPPDFRALMQRLREKK